MPDKPEIIPAGTVAVRESFDSEEVLAGTDLSTGVDFKTQLEAAMILADRKPRRIDVFRLRMLEDCKDPTFAEQALYHKPVGKKLNPVTDKWEEQVAVNFSVRFIEAALQAFGNFRVFEWLTYEDDKRARIHVAVIDVEQNNGYGTDRMIEKLVERKKPQGRTIRGQRPNTYGDMVYLVDATADEFRNLYGAERSKLRRDNGQRILPFHILSQCREQIEKTVKDENAKHPETMRDRLRDAFYSVGVSPQQLEDYLGHPLQQLNDAEMIALRVIFTGIKEGESTWSDIERLKAEPAEGESQQEAEPQKKPGKLKDRLMKKSEQQTLDPGPVES
jgi:hypothetical protein